MLSNRAVPNVAPTCPMADTRPGSMSTTVDTSCGRLALNALAMAGNWVCAFAMPSLNLVNAPCNVSPKSSGFVFHKVMMPDVMPVIRAPVTPSDPAMRPSEPKPRLTSDRPLPMPVMALPATLVAPEAMRVNADWAAFANEPKRPCTPLTVSRTMFIALFAA